MKQLFFYTQKHALRCMILLFVLSFNFLPIFGQGLEDFTNSTATTSYADGSFVGNNEVTWSFGHSRDQGDYPIESNGLMLRRGSDSYLEATIAGGIGTFSFQYRKAFTGSTDRQLSLIVNGEQVATTEIFGNASGADETTYTFSHEVNAAGNVVVRIKDVATDATNRQATIDNISWTAFGASELTANFSGSPRTILVGETVAFSDASFGGTATGWNWTFEGGTPATSTEQNPVVTYSNAGSFDVSLTVSDGTNSDTKTVEDYITVNVPTITIFEQTWDDLQFGDWTPISVVGDQSWEVIASVGNSGTPCARINGYSGGAQNNEDWLISPSFNIQNFNGVVLSFTSAKEYNGPDLEAYFSNDFDGTDMASATWQLLTCTVASGSTFTASGDISLDNFTGTDCHVAFKYNSSTDGAARWRVDDILLTATSVISGVVTANFSAIPTTVTEGETVTFTDLSIGEITSWSWTFEGGTPATSTEQNPTVTYTAAGIYDVSLTVANESNSDTKIEEDAITVSAPVITIFEQNWNEQQWNGWQQISVIGDQVWNINGSYGIDNSPCVRMSGYSGGNNENEDWLISPAFNIDAYDGVALTFQNAYNYSGNALEVFFSNDFDGTNPATATWQPLTFTLSSGSWSWTPSGNIDLSGFTGNNCFIAFKYTCTTSAASTWELDDILLTAEQAEPEVVAADFSATPTTILEGETVTFTDASTGNPTGWAWIFEGGEPATSIEQNPIVTYATAGTYDVTLTVTDGTNDSTKTIFDYITVEAVPVGPTAAFTASATTINVGESVTFTNTSTGTVTAFAWTFEGGEPTTSIEENPTVTYATAGTYDVKLLVSDGTLSDSLLIEDYILVNEAGQIICNNSFEVWTEGLPNCWNGSKTNIGAANILQVTEGAHTGNFALQLVNTATSHKRFTSQPTSLEAGKSYQISFWIRGAGNIRTALYTESYQPYNEYMVVSSAEWEQLSQVVTADVTCSTAEFIFSVHSTAEASGHIQIDDVEVTEYIEPLVADFTATPTTLFEGETVTFTDASTGNPTGWTWIFEGGEPATSTEQNPIVTYATAGTYDVTLTVTDGTNDSTKTVADYIIVEAAPVGPTASFTASATTINVGESVTFTNTSTGTVTAFAWTFEGGEPATSIEENPTITYATAGTYDVKLLVSDGTLSDSLLIEDYILVNEEGQIICNNSFEIWTEGLPNCWNGSKTNIGAANILQVTEGAHTGNYALQLVNTATSHKRFTSQPTSLEAGKSYQISFWVRGAGNIRTALYTESYQPYNEYMVVSSAEWEQLSQVVTADVTCSTAEFIFSVHSTAEANGHIQIDDVEVTEYIEPLAADFTATPTTLFEGETVTFTDASTGNPTGWTWIFEGGEPATSTEQNPIVAYATAGTYDVTLTVTDGTNDSTKTVADYIIVEAAPVGPTASFTASATTINVGESVTFTNTSTGTVTAFAWTFEGGEPATSIEENPTVTYAAAGTYDVKLLVSDGTLSDSLLIEDFILVNEAGQIICNNSFEIWTEGLPNCWSGVKTNIGAANILQVTEGAHTGNYAVQLVNATTSLKRFTSQPTSVIAGVEYSISFWVRGGGEMRTGIYDGGTTGSGYQYFSTYITATTEWTQYTQNITATNTNDAAEFIIGVKNTVEGNGHIQIDDVEVTAIVPSVIADFEANETNISEGGNVQFTDLSIGEVTTWSWIFEGGSPATSTEQNPTVTYNESGVYDVTLYISDGTNVDSMVKEDYITVLGGIVLFDQNWNEQTWNGWTQVSVIGDQVWETSSSYGVGNTPCVRVSGYSGQAYDNEDWLISPAFDLNAYEGVVLSFQNAYNYSGNAMELFFSNDYDGSNPTTATWQPLTYTLSSGSWAWTPSGNVALDAFEGSNCYIGFKYTSTTAGAATWEVDDILLIAESEISLTANFSGTPTALMTGETVAFSDLSQGNPTSWNWTFEGGTPPTSTEQNPTVLYATEGIFDVTLTVSDGINTDTKVMENYITVTATPPAPEAAFIANSTNIFVGDVVSFTDQSLYTPTAWAWTFEGGTPAASTEQNPTVQYLTAGTYDVQLEASSEWGSDIENKTDYITVQSMDADFSASSTLVIVDGTSTFTDLTTGNPTSWSWTVSGPETMNSTEQNPTFTFTIEGTYSVTLVASNAYESITETKTDYINVIAGGEITCNNSFEYWTEGLPDCWNGSKTNIGVENIVQYTESAHTGTSACQLINATSSHKRFTCQATTIEGGVEYTISFWVRGAGDVRTGLFDSFSGSSGYTTYNEYITVNSTDWAQYSQNVLAGGTTDIAEFIFSVRNTGEANGHLQIDDVAITAAAPPALTANFEANATYIPEGTAVQFTDLSLGSPTNWSWSFEGGTPTTSQDQNPSIVFSTEGTYDVTLTVSNGTETNTKTIEDYITVFGGTVIFNQNWNDQEWYGWSQISIVGDQVWEIAPTYGVGNTPCIKMSGYASGAHANEDWLISPAFNLDNYADVVLSFQNAYSYDGNTMEVFFANDYNGSDPTSATWQPLEFVASAGSFAWTYSGEIALDNFSGENCYIAFKYTCDDAAASTWEVDDILLVSSSAPTLTANFYATPTTVYVGETAQFTDASTGNPTSWSWTFEGGSPATSTEQNPLVTYNTVGTYDVTLTISDGENSDTKTMTDFITVIPMLLEPDLVITEIMYNPPESGTDSLEFIEIFNNDAEVVNMAGYKLTTAVDFTFPEILLNPGDYVVVAGNPTAMQNTFGVTAYQWAGSLNNSSEEIVLVNAAETIIDAVTYSKDAPWPTEANGTGYSLDLSDPDSDNSLPENWALSTGFGGVNGNGDTLWATPGAPFGYFLPLVDFAASATTIQLGETVNFSNLTPECNANSFSWIFEGGNPETSTEENPSVNYETLGEFDVTLTVTNEHGTTSLTKADYIQLVNSIGENSEMSIQCYPNPTRGIVTVETEWQNVAVTVFDMNGKMLFQTNLANDRQIDLSVYESGIYFLKLVSTDSKTQSIIRIIKSE